MTDFGAPHGLYDCFGKIEDMAKTGVDRATLGAAAGLPRLSEIELLRGLVRRSLPVDKFPLELTEALYDAGLIVFTDGNVIGMMLNARGRARAWRIAKRAANSANRDKQSGEAPYRQLPLQATSPPQRPTSDA